MREVDLIKLIKNELVRDHHPAARRLPTFYPSSASAKLPTGEVLGGCWRSAWYRVNGVEKTNKREFYIAMIHELGNAVERTVVEAMKKIGIYEHAGVKFYDPLYNVSGELDVVGRYRKPDLTIGYYGVEVKSVYGIGATLSITGRSRAYRGQPPVDPKPKDQNLMQTMIYIDQFKPSGDSKFALEGFKLLYFPRDKPNDGRSYDVTLVSVEELRADTSSAMNSTLLLTYGDLMVPGERYALIETKDYTPYIETRFSIEAIYRRFKEQKEIFESGEVPDRPFQKFYTGDRIEEMWSQGKISKTDYQKWSKGHKRLGHFLCQSYCDYRDHCYTPTGIPRPEADTPPLVQIEN